LDKIKEDIENCKKSIEVLHPHDALYAKEIGIYENHSQTSENGDKEERKNNDIGMLNENSQSDLENGGENAGPEKTQIQKK